MSETEHWPLHDLSWSDYGIWHIQLSQPLENHAKIHLLPKIHHHRKTISWRHTCNDVRQRRKSVAFPATNAVKKGCVLIPTLFSIMFSAMLFDEFSDWDNGIDIRYRTDGSVFNLRRLQTKTKLKTNIVNEFLFDDDCALNVKIKANMQNSVDKFSIACDNFGLTISKNKKNPKVMHQPGPEKPYCEPNITIQGQRLKVIEKFTYLGSTLTESIVMDDEVNTRLEKSSATFGRLKRNEQNRRGITEATKIMVCRAVVLTSLFIVVKCRQLISGI